VAAFKGSLQVSLGRCCVKNNEHCQTSMNFDTPQEQDAMAAFQGQSPAILGTAKVVLMDSLKTNCLIQMKKDLVLENWTLPIKHVS
jgi:hypothetical protein